ENGQHSGGSGGTDNEERGGGPMLITPSIDGDGEDGDGEDGDGEDGEGWRPASRGRRRVAMELGEPGRGDETDPGETEEMVSEGEANGESEAAVNERPEPPTAVAIAPLSASPTEPPRELQQATRRHPPRHP